MQGWCQGIDNRVCGLSVLTPWWKSLSCHSCLQRATTFGDDGAVLGGLPLASLLC
jgi:hypothetical protein